MPDHNLPPRGDGRQRRLDDLFGDDPHLSPTMRARRLAVTGPPGDDQPARASMLDAVHAPPDDAPEDFWNRVPTVTASDRDRRAIEEPDEPLTPTPRLLRVVDSLAREPRPGSRRPAPMGRDAIGGDRSESAVPPRAEPAARAPIRITEAAALLRSESPAQSISEHGRMLERLRSGVLLRWLAAVPPRNGDALNEER
ncbi:MAG TPA: hypothetical protein VKT77_05685 [Chthonomonadaceae bacterium]|nr:hypothetical protein [Chthonomonadaceae bacterium]